MSISYNMSMPAPTMTMTMTISFGRQKVDTKKYIIEEKEPEQNFISSSVLSTCLYHHHLATVTYLPILFLLAFFSDISSPSRAVPGSRCTLLSSALLHFRPQIFFFSILQHLLLLANFYIPVTVRSF